MQPASASTDANLSIGFRVRGGGGTSSFWGFWCLGILGGWGKGETKELVEDRLRESPLFWSNTIFLAVLGRNWVFVILDCWVVSVRV